MTSSVTYCDFLCHTVIGEGRKSNFITRLLRQPFKMASPANSGNQELKMTLNEVKVRTRRPKIEEPVGYNSISKLNADVDSMDSYFKDQIKAYEKLKTLREEAPDENLVLVSGIVETAKAVEEDLNWSTSTLTGLFSRKKELVEQNRETYLDYQFTEFTKPVFSV